VFDHGRFILGPEVDELEERLASYCGVSQAVTCASGTDALLLVLLAWGIGPGDAVFVPAFSFVAPAEVASLLGATPVFVDVSPSTFNLDPTSLARAVDEVAPLRPAAVIPVDLFGLPADHPAIAEVAAAATVPVLCDGAQSFGASRDGVRTGGFGQATATSFFPAKPLGCYGDGGAVLTDDGDLASQLRSLRAHGRGDDKYDTARVGINSRLDTVQAAILLQKLSIFDEEMDARQRVAERYRELLAAMAETPAPDDDAVSVWAQYTIQHPHRDRVAAELRRAGVPTAVHYPMALSDQPAFRTSAVTDPAGLTVSRQLCERVLSLPMHPYLTAGDQERVAKALAGAGTA
jgi:dTDP-4-amino-4,6-dideoxygalactose transaminase